MRWFMLAMVLANIGSEMFTFLLPLYISELGASVAQVGLVFSLSSIAILVLQILGGWISDSIGSTKMSIPEIRPGVTRPRAGC